MTGSGAPINELSNEEVRRLVYSYKEEAITDELVSFGKMLLAETDDRAKQIDSKATSVMGWATAILAFLFTQLISLTGVVNLALGVASGLFAILAVRGSYKALQARRGWLWPSDRDWFEQTAFASSDELKRFHLRSLHEVRSNRMKITEVKSNYLWRAEKYLVSAALFLIAGIAVRALLASYPVAIRIFGQGIRMRLGGF